MLSLCGSVEKGRESGGNSAESLNLPTRVPHDAFLVPTTTFTTSDHMYDMMK